MGGNLTLCDPRWAWIDPAGIDPVWDWIDPAAADPAAVDQYNPVVNPARGGSIQRLDQSPDALINPALGLIHPPLRQSTSWIDPRTTQLDLMINVLRESDQSPITTAHALSHEQRPETHTRDPDPTSSRGLQSTYE
jgi:hypothetical protein